MRFGLLILTLFLPGIQALWAEEVEASASAEINWTPKAAVINNDSPLNPDNLFELNTLTNHAVVSLWFDTYFGEYFLLSGNFQVEADNGRVKRLMSSAPTGQDYSTLGDVSIGFDQLYFEWTLPNYWYLGFGKYPVRLGYSSVYSPFNYSARTMDFQSTRGQWNAWIKGSAGPITFGFNYYPSMHFRGKKDLNKRTDAEILFASLESMLYRHTFSAHLAGFFFDSLDTNLNFFLQDKGDNDFKDFFMAAGAGFSWSISDKFIWRGEFIYGNGYDDMQRSVEVTAAPNVTWPEWTDRNLDTFYPKALTGFTFTLLNNLEISTEYFYNGAGLSDDARSSMIDALKEAGSFLDSVDATTDTNMISANNGFLGNGFDNWKIFEMGQHYVFLQLRRINLFQRMDVVNTSVFLANDMSFMDKLSITYNVSDNFSLGTDLLFFLFKENGAYSLAPENFSCVLSAKFSY